MTEVTRMRWLVFQLTNSIAMSGHITFTIVNAVFPTIAGNCFSLYNDISTQEIIADKKIFPTD